MNCCLYLRVSTSDQTTGNQLPALEAYAAGKGYTVAAVYRENESAWKAGYQKELARLLDDIRSGKRRYDAVLVFALDRLSRLGPLAALTLIDAFKAHWVKVESLQEPFTSLPYGFDSVIVSWPVWPNTKVIERARILKPD